MIVTTATEAAPGRPANEDQVFQQGRVVGVFDGVTAPDLPDGCEHGPAWYVRRLVTRLREALADAPAAALSEVLGQAITRVRGDHPGCDLANPSTPASTVCLVRADADHLEYLLLGDSPLVAEQGGRVVALTDDRFDLVYADIRAEALRGDVPLGSAEHIARQRTAALRKQELTNTPGGYWIAAADPRAAANAITGRLPLTGPDEVRRAVLLTDGASCAVDMFGLFDWAGLLDLVTEQGPEELIRRVRAAETADRDGYARPRHKRHDDATVALCRFGTA
ncbi:protein phosphatase 2C domain-containing protein [Catellatospora tritici]|uniref:protein phosphatase 2C domain-containing protein n=1 Tax=Catellatospora tritici TaxID=2851566 RepID=UPI001C2DD5C5|nr:protein phosphatase 2C domain-containing protein [Catellatospora tritici]MBV1853746.1 protein phosphatase 2C domain-containing protein [Catellatospora tritici]